MAILLSHLASAVTSVLAIQATTDVSSLPTPTIVQPSIISIATIKGTSPTESTAVSVVSLPRTISSNPSIPSETKVSSGTSVSKIVSVNVSSIVSTTSTSTTITKTSLSQAPATTLSSSIDLGSSSTIKISSLLSASSISILSKSSISSRSMPPTPTSAASSTASANPQSETDAGNGPQNHTAAIVVATLLGTAVLLSVAYLLFRYCPPIRNRWEALQEQKRKLRSYREGIDDRKTPSGEGGINKNRRSFLARNWYWNGTQKETEEEQRAGLGLGPVDALKEKAMVETVQPPPPRAIRQSEIGLAIS